MRRLSGRWLCTERADHVYHETARPPKWLACATSTARRSIQRDDDKPDDDQGAAWRSSCRRCSRSSTTTPTRGVLSAVDGDQPVDEVTDALMRAIAQPARVTQ